MVVTRVDDRTFTVKDSTGVTYQVHGPGGAYVGQRKLVGVDVGAIDTVWVIKDIE